MCSAPDRAVTRITAGPRPGPLSVHERTGEHISGSPSPRLCSSLSSLCCVHGLLTRPHVVTHAVLPAAWPCTGSVACWWPSLYPRAPAGTCCHARLRLPGVVSSSGLRDGRPGADLRQEHTFHRTGVPELAVTAGRWPLGMTCKTQACGWKSREFPGSSPDLGSGPASVPLATPGPHSACLWKEGTGS